MIGKLSTARHGAVLLAVGGTAALAGFGVIGGGHHPERFDAKTVVIAPDGETGIRITEYVDIDFGTNDRHGYERRIPNDFGPATRVVASSPDANADVSVVDFGTRTRIRLGDPDRTISGQHRYVLAYTLPDAHFDEVGLALDVVGAGTDNETGRFEVVVTGFDLSDTRCDVGRSVSVGGCELVAAPDGTYRAVLEPLAARDGLTVGGTITGLTAPVTVDPPPIPERRGDGPGGIVLALAFALLGTAGALPVYHWVRRRGRNEVYAGGAADAAYGSLPPPGEVGGDRPVTLVPDDDLGDLATIEFAPPKGLDPWEAQVLLTERCNHDTVEAWLSGLVGKEAITVTEHDNDVALASGPRRGDLDDGDAKLLSRILSIDDPYVTGTYDRRFADAWKAIHSMQVDRIHHSGWWKHLPPGSGISRTASGSTSGILMALVVTVVWGAWMISAFAGALRSWPIAITVAVVFPAVVAFLVYRVMLPARSAKGSALALQVESFRRFLHASEARHVEWAWSNDLLREYSAWAVALGEADAWSEALERANVPEPARLAAGPILVHAAGSSMRSSRTSSGGGGDFSSGGFSGGGGVGGGGGGGSSGSW